MEFKDGSTVYTQEGKEVGSLLRVVLDPHTNEATHIVIQRGLIFVSDKVVPVSYVASASDAGVILNCSIQELEELSPLDIEKPIPENERVKPKRIYIPTMGGAYPTVIEQPEIDTRIERTIPENLVALKAGARVKGQDGGHLGNVERVFTDPETGEVTHFVVSHGFLKNGKKEIPVQWARMIDENEIELVIPGKEFKDLPEYQE